jgi:hypothetical protein
MCSIHAFPDIFGGRAVARHLLKRKKDISAEVFLWLGHTVQEALSLEANREDAACIEVLVNRNASSCTRSIVKF